MPPPDLIRRLFLQQQFRLMDYIAGLVRHSPDADDIFQDVSLTILGKESAPDLPSEPERFAAWCRGVARNRILHHWRSKARSRIRLDERIAELADQAFCEAEDDGDENAILDFAHRQALAGCLDRVDARGRELLEQRYAAGRTCEEIAAGLGRASAGVRMLLMRLRERLRACIDDQVRLAGERR